MGLITYCINGYMIKYDISFLRISPVGSLLTHPQTGGLAHAQAVFEKALTIDTLTIKPFLKKP